MTKSITFVFSLFLVFFTSALSAQPACSSTAPEIAASVLPVAVCDNTSTDALVLTTPSDLPNTEYLIVDLNRVAADGLGNAVVGIDDDGAFVPADLGLTGNLNLAVVPFSYNIQDFRTVIDGVFNNMYLGKTCCAYVEILSAGFCAAMIAKGITDTQNINSLADIIAIIGYLDATNGTYSIPKLISKIILLENLVKAVPDECLDPMRLCYALGTTQQLYVIQETPTILEVTETGNYQITVDAYTSAGTLEYALDPNGPWQSSNVFDNVPVSGMVYVRNTVTGCMDSFPYELIALPVELTGFKGRAEGNTNLLYWTTETETNNLGFTIMRSVDGVNFQKMTWINGAGSSQTMKDYTYRDTAPLNGKNYYQLTMQDYDGGLSFSEIIVLQRAEHAGFDVLSLSHPVANTLQVAITNDDETGSMEFFIHDIAGKKVNQGTETLHNGINNLTINVADLSPSIYIFTAVKNGHKIKGYKFLVY